MTLHLQLIGEEHAVCRLPAGSALPAWFQPQPFSNVSWTDDELSLVCTQALVPEDVQCERGWRVLKLHGPFAFELTGILLQVLAPLAAAHIGIFALSTFDTDYVLVKQAQLDAAIDALRQAGHTVER